MQSVAYAVQPYMVEGTMNNDLQQMRKLRIAAYFEFFAPAFTGKDWRTPQNYLWDCRVLSQEFSLQLCVEQ